MEIICTGCNASYHLSEDRIPLKTTTGTCKKCGTKIVIRGKNDTASTTEEMADTNQPIEDEETKQCPYCAETIKKDAKICRFCQIDLITGQPFRIQKNDKDSIQPKARSHRFLKHKKAIMSLIAIMVIAVSSSIFYKIYNKKQNAIPIYDSKSDAKRAVIEVLKDPDSVKFGDFTEVGDNACITVNARNSMGGYVGAQQFTLFKINGKWVAAIELIKFNQSMSMTHKRCIDFIREMKR